jgi:hypothetical protein
MKKFMRRAINNTDQKEQQEYLSEKPSQLIKEMRIKKCLKRSQTPTFK